MSSPIFFENMKDINNLLSSSLVISAQLIKFFCCFFFFLVFYTYEIRLKTLYKKDSCQFLAKECAQYWLTA